MTGALAVIFLVCEVFTILFLIRSLTSLMSPRQIDVSPGLIYQLTEPILVPLRRILPMSSRVDYSPFIAFAILQVIILVIAVI